MTVSYSNTNNAAPLARQILQQVKYELLLTARRGENVLITLIVPVVLLIFFASLNLVPKVGGSTINFLLPGILALAIIAAGMVNLGIATAYERYYRGFKTSGKLTVITQWFDYCQSNLYPASGAAPGHHAGRGSHSIIWLATSRITPAGLANNRSGNGDVRFTRASNGRSFAS